MSLLALVTCPGTIICPVLELSKYHAQLVLFVIFQKFLYTCPSIGPFSSRTSKKFLYTFPSYVLVLGQVLKNSYNFVQTSKSSTYIGILQTGLSFSKLNT